MIPNGQKYGLRDNIISLSQSSTKLPRELTSAQPKRTETSDLLETAPSDRHYIYKEGLFLGLFCLTNTTISVTMANNIFQAEGISND